MSRPSATGTRTDRSPPPTPAAARAAGRRLTCSGRGFGDPLQDLRRCTGVRRHAIDRRAASKSAGVNGTCTVKYWRERHGKRRRPSSRSDHVHPFSRNVCIEETFGHSRCAGTNQLSDDVAHQLVVRVRRSAVGAPGDERVGAGGAAVPRAAACRAERDARRVGGVVPELAVGESELDRAGSRAERLVVYSISSLRTRAS